MRTRRLLVSALKDGPLTADEWARRTGLSIPTIRYHLAALEQRHGVERRRIGRRTYFGVQPVSWQPVLLTVPEMGMLHDWVCRQGRIQQADVVRTMQKRGWSPSTTQHRLHRLTQAGLLKCSTQGKEVFYEGVDP